MRVLLARSAALIALLPVPAAAADDSAPVVSPDRIEDAPSIKPDPYPDFDNFAWRAFIALNWPSLTDPAHRGEPDRAKTLGDPGPRVWETFKARYELFQVGPTGARSRQNPGRPMRRRTRAERMSTIAQRRSRPSRPSWISISPPSCPASALIRWWRRIGAYTRYEARINEPEYSALAVHGWSLGQNLPDPAHPAELPVGSIAVKAAWRPLNAADTPAVRARYYVVENANVVDVAKTLAAGHVVCSKSDVALVGLHIVIRTKERPQGLWGTFEHVDNVPPAGEGEAREPDARQAGAPYSYFDASKPKLGLWPTFGLPDTLPVSMDHPPKIDPTPMQVVRRHPIHASTMALNRAYWALPGIKGTVWEHYMLVASQWPTIPASAKPAKRRRLFPRAAAHGGRAARELSVGGRAQGKPGQHDDRDLFPGRAVKLHVLPPEPIQRARARLRRHAGQLSLATRSGIAPLPSRSLWTCQTLVADRAPPPLRTSRGLSIGRYARRDARPAAKSIDCAPI